MITKEKKNIFSFFKMLSLVMIVCVCLTVCLFTLSGCKKEKSHTHSFGTEWEKDETNHWHECSGCDDKKDIAVHIYDDACDTSCNVCGHVRTITHNFGKEWVMEDETNHYHVCLVCGAHDEDIPHIFVDDHYSVNGVKAYLNKVCSCGKTTVEELEAETFVIVTPSTVQAELDKNIDGKTIIFSAGNYDEVIYIRPSYDTTTTYSFVSTTERGTTVISNEDVKNGDAKTRYHYFRNLQNVKFVGVEGVIISNTFSFYTGPVGYASVSHPTVLSYDAVKQIDFSQTSTSAYASYSHINIKNITIENLNFTTDSGMISVYYKTFENSTENFTVKNCNFENTTDTKTKCALQITARDCGGIIKNVTFENNNVDGYFKALEVVAFENAKVRGNTIVNCKHNGISLFGGNLSGKEQRMKGTIVVENNIFTNGTNQPIKIFYGQDCVVSIKNNVINNYQHSGNYLIEVSNISDTKEGVYSTLTFVNNTYNGHTYMDIVNGKINELGNTDEDDYIALYIRPSQFVN